MIEKLKKSIIDANTAYREGNPIISDYEYDKLLDDLSILSPNDELLNKIGITILDDSRKSKLPIGMFSMNKIKTIGEIDDWCRSKKINKNEIVILTPKLDGLSMCVEELTDKAYTRGDGIYGQKSDDHYKLISNHLDNEITSFKYTYGEIIMPKLIFEEKYSEKFANGRNLVSGLLNSQDPKESLRDCVYIKYGAIPLNNNEFKTKQDIIDLLNMGQKVTIPYYLCKINELNEDLLIDLYNKWKIEYEIDGVIIEINDIELQNSLGREISTKNPSYARAFKHESFMESAITEILGITWTISKNGLLKPVAHVNPVKLDGVIVSNCTLNNAKFVKDMGLGVGSIVKIIRSGLVIPKIVGVIKKVDFDMPIIDGVEIGWNDNQVELITMDETDDQKLKKIISFFEILECDNFGEGVITQLWKADYKSIKSILNINKLDLDNIDGFGKRKAKIVYDSIKKCTKDVDLSKLMHASGIFGSMLGSKKLSLLVKFSNKPTVEQVMEIDGFAEISAKSYVDNYDKFYEFIKDLPITIKNNDEMKVNGDLNGLIFVFTGIRLKNEQDILIKRGAKVMDSISKNTTHLVCKDSNSGSSKLEKAKSLGIKIIGVDELMSILNNTK